MKTCMPEDDGGGGLGGGGIGGGGIGGGGEGGGGEGGGGEGGGEFGVGGGKGCCKFNILNIHEGHCSFVGREVLNGSHCLHP
jgi:hypothetical protein